MSSPARLPLVTDASSVGSDFDPQVSVLVRALINKMRRDEAKRIGFHPPGDALAGAIAAASPRTYQNMTRPIEGGAPDAPNAAAAVGGLFMSMGGMPAPISRAGSLQGGTDWMPKGSRPRLRGKVAEPEAPQAAVKPTSLEEQFEGSGARQPKGADKLLGRLHENFVRKPAEESIGGFSNPSKMPCPSWSIDAGLCKTGSALGKVKGSVCENCFAKGGRYVMPNVQEAMKRRLDAFNSEPDRFGEKVATALPRGQKEFRWFDSGDVQSPKMFEQIVKAARLRPDVKFWLPTKEAATVMAWMRQNGELPENLAVRQSLPMKDVIPAELGPRESRKLPLAGVTTDRAKATCAATLGDKTCETAQCRACWDKSKDVVYLEH